MLVRFRVSNFLSFRDDTEFNMLTGAPRRLEGHVYQAAGLELLKIAGIYGANGAGKSNLVKAALYLRQLVLQDWASPAAYRFKLGTETELRPSSFELEFIAHGVSYLYGLDVSARQVEEEWLYKTSINKPDVLIFHRYTKAGNTKIECHPSLQKTEEDKLRIKLYETEMLAETANLLKLFSQSKAEIPEIKAAFEWFDKHLLIIQPDTKFKGVMRDMVQNPFFFNFVNDMLCSFQTGIRQIEIKTYPLEEFFGKDAPQKTQELRTQLDALGPDGLVFIENNGTSEEIMLMYENQQAVVKRILFWHKDGSGAGVPFELWEESDGTRRLYDLAPAIFKAVFNTSAILIDEIEHSIHPTLLREIISKFANTADTKGQLLFTTHEAYLLDQDYMRQDEFWFAEKNESGATSFTPLSDYKIRYDLDLRKGYLSGRFGAVPSTSGLNKLQWNQYAKAEPEPSL